MNALKKTNVRHVLAVPSLIYLSLHVTRPGRESFDIVAQVTPKLTADLPPGCHRYMTETAITSNLAGAVYVACTRIPAINREYIFVGAFRHWFYIGSTKVDESDAAVAINASIPSPCSEDK
jgi:hypothetical protein